MTSFTTPPTPEESAALFNAGANASEASKAGQASPGVTPAANAAAVAAAKAEEAAAIAFGRATGSGGPKGA